MRTAVDVHNEGIESADPHRERQVEVEVVPTHKPPLPDRAPKTPEEAERRRVEHLTKFKDAYNALGK